MGEANRTSPRRSHAREFALLSRALADARPLWALVALVAVLAVVSACALDTETLDRKRADIVRLCEGALTPHLKAACETYGIDTGRSPAVR